MNYSKLFKLSWIQDPAAAVIRYKFFSNQTDAEKEYRHILESGVCVFGTKPIVEMVAIPKLKHEMIAFLNDLADNPLDEK